MFARISRAEVFKRPQNFVEPVLIPYETHVSEQCNVDGKIVSVETVKTVDPVEQYKGMRALDFCLENQISSGNIANLAQSTILDDDPSHLESSVSRLEQFIKSEQNGNGFATAD